MSKHTDGPWKTREAPNADIHIFSVEHERIVSTVHADVDGFQNNAALIEAAPEMLELLEDIRDNEILNMDNESLYRIINKARGVDND